MRRFGERAADTLSVPAAENAGGSEGGPTETLLREAFGIRHGLAVRRGKRPPRKIWNGWSMSMNGWNRWFAKSWEDFSIFSAGGCSGNSASGWNFLRIFRLFVIY